MKQFDQIFREQAEKAFSTYNADDLAQEGWKSFVSRQKGRKRFAIIIPFWAKAASVAVLISVGSLFVYKTLRDDSTGELALKQHSVSEPDNKVQIPVVSDLTSHKDRLSSPEIVPSSHSIILSAPEVKVAEAVIMQNEESDLVKIVTDQEYEVAEEDNADEVHIAENKTDVNVTKEIPSADIADEVPADKKTSIIAGLSGMMSSIEDLMENSPGVSVGFYVDRKLTRRLSVRPGLALAKHSYGSTNVSSGKVFMSSYTNTGAMTGSVDSYENQLDMVTLEVPVNLVYTILERGKSSLFVSAGVSTMVYLDQNFSSSFTNVYTEQKVDLASGNAYQETRTQDVSVESDEEAFSHVDYFGLTNLSAGYSLPLKKGGNMLIEPFVQLPVSDLTSFNVRIRYGGLSFKFRFGQESQQAK
ncbi:MAG: outer membrane beta-barrel protein [Bacteroidia bacterium]|nr:outer membrane beta-barrel protein [Bacteroidia bacterium]